MSFISSFDLFILFILLSKLISTSFNCWSFGIEGIDNNNDVVFVLILFEEELSEEFLDLCSEFFNLIFFMSVSSSGFIGF